MQMKKDFLGDKKPSLRSLKLTTTSLTPNNMPRRDVIYRNQRRPVQHQTICT